MLRCMWISSAGRLGPAASHLSGGAAHPLSPMRTIPPAAARAAERLHTAPARQTRWCRQPLWPAGAARSATATSADSPSSSSSSSVSSSSSPAPVGACPVKAEQRRQWRAAVFSQMVRIARFIFCPWERAKPKDDWVVQYAIRFVRKAVRASVGGLRSFLKAFARGVSRATHGIVDAAHNHMHPAVGAALLWTAIVMAMVACAPTAPFNLAAGAILGISNGALVAVTALWTGSLIDFWLAKGLFHEFAQRQLESLSLVPTAGDGAAPRFDGAAFSFMLRLCVLLPAGAVSYGLGATGMDVRDYAFGTLAGQSVTAYLISSIGYYVRVLSKERSIMRRIYLRISMASVTASLVAIGLISTHQLSTLAMQ